MQHKHTTVYQQLLTMGYTDEQIRTAVKANQHPATRAFSIAFSDTADGPIVGIAYSGDFRAEEETGIGDIYRALGGPGTHTWRMANWAEQHIAHFEGIPSLIISTHALAPVQTWGKDITSLNGGISAARVGADTGRYSDTYDNHYSTSLQYAQGIGDTRVNWESITELRTRAERLGIQGPLPRKKADLLNRIISSAEYQATADTPDAWPGWFHHGSTLVLRADRGIVADILNILHAAAEAGQLAFGGGRVAFGSGMAFYDARDVGPKLHAQRKAEQKAYDKAMRALEPVAKELKAKGHNWYFLGRPTTLDNGDGRMVERYWLNSYGRGPGYSKQIFGYFTLAELKSESFVPLFTERETVRGR